MKKIYNIPTVKSVDLSAEGNLLTLSLGEGGPGVSENGDRVNKGEELTRQQGGNSLWDTWSN